MSICLESNNVLANQVSTASSMHLSEQTPNDNALAPTSSSSPQHEQNDQPQHQQQQLPPHPQPVQPPPQVLPAKTVAKLLVANHQATVVGNVTPVLQKISNPPVITVLNSAGGPLTVLKTICVTSGVSSAPHFSLVNNQPLTVTNAAGKTPTITLLNAPVTVVKVPTAAQPQQNAAEQVQVLEAVTGSPQASIAQTVPTIIENRAHNVFVKNTLNTCTTDASSVASSDVPQSQKFLTASTFPQTNVLATIPPTGGKTANGQRNKLKIVSNVLLPGTSHNTQTSNIVLNKPIVQQQQQHHHQQQQQPQRLVQRQKVLGPNVNQTKYVNKLQNNLQKQPLYNLKQLSDNKQQKIMYPTHKSQIKTLSPVNNYAPKAHGIKTLTPQQPKVIPGGQVQRTGSGLRTIPPQRPPKLPNKLNYIGKHAVQAQKVKHATQNRCGKPMKQGVAAGAPPPPLYNNYMPPVHANKQLAFNQALTAEILETLSNKSGPTMSYASKNYEILPSRYDAPVYLEQKPAEPIKFEDKTKSGLDALSLICQAVLLDHNYNATLPPDSPTRSTQIPNAPSQINGMSGNSMHLYSPGAVPKNKYPTERKRTLSCSNPVSSSSSMSNMSSLIPSNSASLVNLQDDDATSEISDCSDRKHDTEGEETDTAPEAEAVANDEPYDHYGDYVTRCICGFLHDDGYMVECDRCKVWQHVQCVVKNKQVPDEYLCEKCNPMKPVDPHKARLIQQQWLRERQQLPDLKNFKKDAKTKEPFKHNNKEVPPTDSDSSDTENPRHNNNTAPPKTKTNVTTRKKAEKPLGKHKKEAKESNIQKKTMIKKRERKLVRRKSKLQTKNTEEENHDAFAMTQLPQLRQWIENYEEAVTNHYSPELRARISNIRVNGVHASDTSIPFDPSVNKCRVHTQPLTDLKYLVATVNVPPNTPVIELRGKYMLSTQHRNSGGNLTTRQHAQRPGPFLFFYRLPKDNTEVCVDTRTYGNSARFVRRSCKPNAELRHCIEKGVLHLYIVAISAVEKNVELTIKHESHDLAAVGTTQIACYCGSPDDCKINKSTTLKKNGEHATEGHRKRRGRRTVSVSVPSEPETPPVTVKEEPLAPPAPPQPIPPPSPPPVKVKIELPEPPVEVKVEPKEELPVDPPSALEIKEEPIDVKDIKHEEVDIKEENPCAEMEVSEPPSAPETPEKEEKEHKEQKEVKKSSSTVSTRRSSQHKAEKEKDEEKPALTPRQEKAKNKKLSREERKLEAILRAIEQMEKADQRKQEHKQTKQVQRRDSEPSPNCKEEEKPLEAKQKRKRRKGRARTTSTHSARRVRLNSGDSYFTSGDENMLSPNEGTVARKPEESNEDSLGKSDGLLLALTTDEDSSVKVEKSPIREHDSNSNSAHSSPETPLSLACSLVQAAVEPLESGFKFPKTKKGLMNEWLNKTPDSLPCTPSPLSPHISSTEMEGGPGFYTPTKNATNAPHLLNETGPRGSAKKRWLRQAISEDKCDSPQESPPLNDSVAPPKKRRLPRESISNDTTPPSTPTGLTPSINRLDGGGQEGCVEIVFTECDDSPTETLESDAVLKERAAEMKQEFGKCVIPPALEPIAAQRPDSLPFGCLMDPRLRNHHALFNNSDHLVGTVEKTLSILGLEEQKMEITTPAKRKLSITEYRQRKKLNNNDISDKSEETSATDDCVNEENNSSESFKLTSSRPRLNSESSSSGTSSDDEQTVLPELPTKAPAFNSEPTELERQREMQSLRLKKAFGLSIDVEPRKPALDVEAILNCDLPTMHVIKPNVTLDNPIYASPTGCDTTPVDSVAKSASNSPRLHALLSRSASPTLSCNNSKTDEPQQEEELENNEATPPLNVEQEEERSIELPEVELQSPPPTSPEPMVVQEDDEKEEEEKEEDEAEASEEVSEAARENEEKTEHERGESTDVEEDDKKEDEVMDEDIKPHMFYTPDEEEEVGEKEFTDIESVSYVPPFNNPIYPSTDYTSVIDEDGRYEGRNPSPPPMHLDSVDGET